MYYNVLHSEYWRFYVSDFLKYLHKMHKVVIVDHLIQIRQYRGET